MSDVCVLGAGAWGIALALELNKNGNNVTIWTKLEEEAKMLINERENKISLPNIKIPESILITTSIEEAVKDKAIIVIAVASRFVRSTAASLKGLVKDKQIIVNVGKGIEENTLMTLSEIIQEELPSADVCVLSGPSHAEEVSRGIPTLCVVGANSKATAELVQNAFMNNSFRIYISPDILGIELGGSLKNVIALAAGMLDGMGYGDNTKAALITRGMAEISRLGLAMGAKTETLNGLSGIGDLIVTCESKHSRNRMAGMLMGQGKSMQEAMAEVKQVVEGVYSAKAAKKLAEKYGVTMPIINEVNAVLFENKSVNDAAIDLMVRDRKSEITSDAWA